MRVRGQSAALVLEGDPGKGKFIADALLASAFRVDSGTTTSVPADLGGLSDEQMANGFVLGAGVYTATFFSPTPRNLIGLPVT